jgi:poly(A) polymerase
MGTHGDHDHGQPVTPRAAATWVARRLREAGFRALFAGGCVRDALLGLEPADHDVATDADPEAVRRVFPRAIGVGEAFGVMLVRHGGRTVEVATFRADGNYADGRRPDAVRFSDDREDALRRDFTVNGLFEDPETGEVIDHVGGRADLAAGVLRAIGDPDARLAEDRLRALRAVRFAARFSLAVDPATEAAVRRVAHDLRAVSRERIGNELRRMLAHPTRARAVELVEGLGLAPAALLEPACAVDRSRLAALAPGAPFEEALAAWMLGRPHDGRTAPSCAGDVPHADDSRARCLAWREALVLSNDETDALAATLAMRPRIVAEWTGAGRALRKRLASSSGFGGACALLAAEGQAVAARLASDLPALRAEGIRPAPFVTGDDLVAIGLTPGPRFRGILDAVYDLQLEGAVADRASALEAARQRAGPGSAGGR